MYVVSNYSVAVILCVITMFCWGSWANTQKLAQKSWRFELFYWDYVIGVLLTSLIYGLTIGSFGDQGRSFLDDVGQAQMSNIGKALLGGIIFNAANILIVAAIAVAGMAVAFPVGIGIALVLGVLVNYLGAPQGKAGYLFAGVILVTLAIVLDSIAYRRTTVETKKSPKKGLMLSIAGGILMAFFYRFVASSMAQDFENPPPGLMTPYTAVFIFSIGIFVSNFIFNKIMMSNPVEGSPVDYHQYFAGSYKDHITGILGGFIWCTGMSLNIIAAGKAGFAISYGLGQGATLVAALWGVFIWREFASAPKNTTTLMGMMFFCFISGLTLIIISGLS